MTTIPISGIANHSNQFADSVLGIAKWIKNVLDPSFVGMAAYLCVSNLYAMGLGSLEPQLSRVSQNLVPHHSVLDQR